MFGEYEQIFGEMTGKGEGRRAGHGSIEQKKEKGETKTARKKALIS
jgi:hypothetical protein